MLNESMRPDRSRLNVVVPPSAEKEPLEARVINCEIDSGDVETKETRMINKRRKGMPILVRKTVVTVPVLVSTTASERREETHDT